MSAPNLKEIEWKISELEQKESSWQSYNQLATLYTVRNEMLGMSAPQPQIAAYSEASLPARDTLGQYGDSDFLRAAAGVSASEAWAVMDELMETLQVVNRRAYEGVMRKLEKLR